MHGRLKVRTTEEQAERKRLEREKKLKIYKYAMSDCLNRNKNSQLDETFLKTSEDILLANGDIQTLWNMRRKSIEQFENNKESFNEERMVKYYADEMAITEQCLKKNPKSYSCWHHRRWCLTRSNELGYGEKNNQLSWKFELMLCSKFLESDERNFHCWRHRCFVIETGKLSKLDELEFTYEKICSNFSNYSAWHYRSKLIESLYTENQIDFDIFKKELNLIEQALFTDPNDQSAWIYEKWLLIGYQRSNIKELTFDSNSGEINFKLTKDMNLNTDINFLKFNCEKVNLDIEKWINDKENSTEVSKEWKISLKNLANIYNAQRFVKIEICFKNSGVSNGILLEKSSDKNLFKFKSHFEIKDVNLSSELIIDHLKNIMELSEMESDNSKWCLLTSVELMCCVDFVKYKEKIYEYLDKLAGEVDIYRKNFYLDLKKKICENNKVL